MSNDSSGSEERFRASRRELFKKAICMPLAFGVGGAFAADTGSPAARGATQDPLRDVIVVNSLGALFDREVERTPEQRQRDYSINAYSDVDMITQRSLGYARESGMTAVNITMGYLSGPVDPYEHTVREFGRWYRILQRYPQELLHVLGAQDILRAKAQSKIGVIFGFQNGVAVGDDPTRVGLFADLGLRVFQLTYNKATPLGDGCLEPGDRGLTPLGHEVLAALNEARVISDLSHSGRSLCLDTVRASRRPVTITHTGCRALADTPRNKTDEELRLVAQRGGYVGIYLTPFLRTDGPTRSQDVVAHIEHAWNVCGEDHVGIGTDGLVAPRGNSEADRQRQREYQQQRRKEGLEAPGERTAAQSFAPELTGPNMFRKLMELLRQRGHSQTRIEKFLGGNFLRVSGEIWGA